MSHVLASKQSYVRKDTYKFKPFNVSTCYIVGFCFLLFIYKITLTLLLFVLPTSQYRYNTWVHLPFWALDIFSSNIFDYHAFTNEALWKGMNDENTQPQDVKTAHRTFLDTPILSAPMHWITSCRISGLFITSDIPSASLTARPIYKNTQTGSWRPVNGTEDVNAGRNVFLTCVRASTLTELSGCVSPLWSSALQLRARWAGSSTSKTRPRISTQTSTCSL